MRQPKQGVTTLRILLPFVSMDKLRRSHDPARQLSQHSADQIARQSGRPHQMGSFRKRRRNVVTQAAAPSATTAITKKAKGSCSGFGSGVVR